MLVAVILAFNFGTKSLRMGENSKNNNYTNFGGGSSFGSGYNNGSSGDKICNNCSGTGTVTYFADNYDLIGEEGVCPMCKGTGRID